MDLAELAGRLGRDRDLYSNPPPPVASVAWALVGPFYVMDVAQKRALERSGRTYEICRDTQRSGEECLQWSRQSYDVWLEVKPGPTNFALLALVPVLLAWLVVWALVAIVRWIGRGFRGSPQI